MIFPTSETWDKWAIHHDCHKYFTLRWQEIFHPETLDTWQVRTCNICHILRELMETAEISGSYGQYRHNVPPLINEAISMASRDQVATKYYPFTLSFLESIRQHVKSHKNDAAALEVLKERASLLLHHLRDYGKRIADETYDLLKKHPDRYKLDLYNLTMALGVEYLTAGYSPAFLRKSIDTLTQTSGTAFEERFKNLVHRCDFRARAYSCKFIVILPKFDNLPELQAFGIRLSETRPTAYVSPLEEEFYTQDKESRGVIAEVKVNALDPYSAIPKALEKLECTFSMIRLFVLQRSIISLRSKSALVVVRDEPPALLKLENSFPVYLKDAHFPESRIKKLSERMCKLPQGDRDQLISSLQYHRIALSAPTDEGRIVNLWIALECLTGLKRESKIGAICKYIPPSVAVQNPQKILKGMCVDMNRVWRHLDTKNIRKVMSNMKEDAIRPKDLLEILLDDEDGQKSKAFYQVFNDNPLHVYRVYRLRNRMFKDAHILRRSLLSHKENVEWQLRRVYRARNHVIHRGSCKPGTSQLIQHLHTYLIVTMHNIIYDLGRGKDWGLSQALENRYVMFEHFMAILKNDKDRPVSVGTLLYSSLIFGTQHPPFAWRQEVAKE